MDRLNQLLAELETLEREVEDLRELLRLESEAFRKSRNLEEDLENPFI